MTEALDTDTALDNPDGTHLYEPYYYRDNAAHALRVAQDRWEKTHGGDAARDLVWGVRKIPRPPPLEH